MIITLDLTTIDFGSVILAASAIFTGTGLLWLTALMMPRRRRAY
jgi:hypothetical protein